MNSNLTKAIITVHASSTLFLRGCHLTTFSLIKPLQASLIQQFHYLLFNKTGIMNANNDFSDNSISVNENNMWN